MAIMHHAHSVHVIIAPSHRFVLGGVLPLHVLPATAEPLRNLYIMNGGHLLFFCLFSIINLAFPFPPRFGMSNSKSMQKKQKTTMLMS